MESLKKMKENKRKTFKEMVEDESGMVEEVVFTMPIKTNPFKLQDQEL